MAKFKLTRSNFSLIPEGRHTFHIDAVQYNEAFGKMEIRMTADGQYKYTERFNLLNDAGETNDRAMNSFLYLSRCALNDFDREEFDEQELVGRMFDGEITHWVSDTKTDDDGNPRKYANISKKYPHEEESAEEAPAANETSLSDLLSQLGGA